MPLSGLTVILQMNLKGIHVFLHIFVCNYVLQFQQWKLSQFCHTVILFYTLLTSMQCQKSL